MNFLQVNLSRSTRAAALVALGGAFIGLALSFITAGTANADYSLSQGPYYNYRIGTSTAVWADQGTVLANSTGSPYLPGPEFWDWLATQTLQNPMNKFINTWSGCGNPNKCVIYQNHGTAVGGTACSTPLLSSSVAATVYIMAGTAANNLVQHDSDCAGYGTASTPVFVVSVNTTHFTWTSNRIDHTRRHETAHTLGLADTTVACWWETNNPFTGTWLYPLMKNSSSSCSSYPSNMLPTWNEINAVQGWNGW